MNDAAGKSRIIATGEPRSEGIQCQSESQSECHPSGR